MGFRPNGLSLPIWFVPTDNSKAMRLLRISSAQSCASSQTSSSMDVDAIMERTQNAEESSSSRLIRCKWGKGPINCEGELTPPILLSHLETQTESTTLMDVTPLAQSLLGGFTSQTAPSALPSLHLG
ncbi:hypothetical protein GOBAR_AA21583 [Gossypium barbadense]|uniref:Uncharacterized protein n=1 Tax=Gossypium barbadense TaxID=3634 RepID=A0A2P5X6Y0_GOSBA|nr:hypothetical protein GOBAR_AA21583 [Gossypium barbadense]